MIITAAMQYERIEVLLFDLFKAGRLDKKQIGFVLGIKGAIKRGRVISDAQAWRAREIVADVMDNEPVLDEGDSVVARERASNYEEF